MSGMQRPILFFDLAGTLEVRDPVTGRWGLWPGADRALADLFDDFELHLTTGDGPGGAAGSLQDLDLREFFTGIHAGLPGGGKPFGQLAASLGRRPEECLAIGDSHVFRVDSEGAQEIGWNSLGRARCYFLGDRAETPDTLREESIVLREGLGGTRALVLATDGLSERGIGVANPALAVESCMVAASEAPPDRRSYDVSKRVLATALDAQRRNRSGDNAAAAVVWLAD